MPLRPTDYFFKIPILMYDPFFGDEEEEKAVLNRHKENFSEYLPDYTIGYANILLENIQSYCDTFEKFRSLQAVKDNGFKCILVNMVDGETYFVPWKMSKFEEEYNKHIEKLERDGQPDMINLEMTDEVAEQLDIMLKQWKKDKKKIEKLKQQQIIE